MRRDWQPEELIDCWTLVDRDWELVANKTGATRLGFALLLKFFELEARFPAHAAELPPAAVEYVAGLVKVEASELEQYEWSGRTIKYHRAQIREASGFREPTRADEDQLARWLADEVCPGELSEERQRTALLGRCREERLEPPGRIGRLLGSARRLADERFCAATVARLDELAVERLEELVAEDEPDSSGEATGGGPGLFAELRADPGPPGLESLLCEIARLERVRAIGLPADLFSEADEKRVALWRARAAAEHPSWLRAHPRDVRLDAARVLLLVSDHGDHRQPGRPAARRGAQDGRAGGLSRRAGAGRRSQGGARQARDPVRARRRRGRAPRRHRSPRDLPGRR